MVQKMLLTAIMAVFLLPSTLTLPVEDQTVQQTQPQPVVAEKPLEGIPQDAQPAQVAHLNVEVAEPEAVPVPSDLEVAPPAEEKSDLDTANTFWGGYYGYKPYYGGWGGYGGGYRRGYGGYGYGRGFGYGGYGGWGGGWGGGFGRRYYWR